MNLTNKMQGFLAELHHLISQGLISAFSFRCVIPAKMIKTQREEHIKVLKKNLNHLLYQAISKSF